MAGSYILNRINGAPADTLFFNRDFLNFCSRGAVDMFLLRLYRNGFLRRLARGIYVRYDCKRKFTAQELGEAKAKRFARQLTVHASNCAARLKFTERVINSQIFHAQGRDTCFETTQGTVRYRAISPRRVALREAGIAGENINALWWLKKHGAKVKHVRQVLASMNRVEREDFLWSHDLMPGWLSDLVHCAQDWKLIFPLRPRPQK